jgi:hypothetical protein
MLYIDNTEANDSADQFYILLLSIIHTNLLGFLTSSPRLAPNTLSLISSSLLQQTINLVLIFQLEHLWCRVRFNAFAVQQKSKRVDLDSATRCIRLKDLLHLGGLLNFEKGFFSGLRA